MPITTKRAGVELKTEGRRIYLNNSIGAEEIRDIVLFYSYFKNKKTRSKE